MKHFALPFALAACLSAPSTVSAQSDETLKLTDAQMEELVRRSYQYVAMFTEDGAQMNALHDYEIVMTAEELPPVNAFWSATLYENETGFFIPNDRFKYSVGENAGFQLDENGGIRIVIAAEQPEGVPEENWLPINRADTDLDIIMRLYAPDLEAYETWTAPMARRLE